MPDIQKIGKKHAKSSGKLASKKCRRLLNDSKAVPSVSGLQKDESKSEKTLSGKVIFLDIRDPGHAKRIELKLRKLHAEVETFLTKEVHYVITTGSLKAQSNPRPSSPAISNTPSPFHVTPSATHSPTPTYINADGKVAALSRGQALAQMARARNRSPSPSSIAANADKLGIKVIAVEAAEKWLDKELKRQGLTITEETSARQGAQQRKPRLSRTLQLPEPHLKVDSCTQMYRTHYKELSSWPHISPSTPSSTCPFDGVSITMVQQSRGAGKEAPASRGNYMSPSTQSNTTQRRSLEGDDSSRLVGVPILTAGDLRRQQEKRKREQRKRGFCECCRIKYNNIDEHLKEPKHVDFVRDKSKHEMLDDLISMLPSASEFLRKTLLRHCSKQQGGKALACDSTVSPVEDSSSDDQVFTISEKMLEKLPHTGGGGTLDTAHTPAVEGGLEEGRNLQTRTYPGFSTPTYTPQYPPMSHMLALDSPARIQDQTGAREDQPGSLSVSLDMEAEGIRPRDQARLSGPPLPAVVIRRPGARGAYGSPHDKWKHSHSPYRRDSSLSPRKVRERSMVFGNASIGSLQSVSEDHSPRRTRFPEEAEGRDRQQGRYTELSWSQDRNRLEEAISNRPREQSSKVSTPGKSFRELASVKTPVASGSTGIDTPHISDRTQRLKRKRVSSASVDLVETAGIEASTVSSTHFSQLEENVKETVEQEKSVPTELENDESKRSLRNRNQTQLLLASVEMENEQNEQNENICKEKDVQAKPDYASLGFPILKHSHRKGQHMPRKQEPGLARSVGEKVRTPCKIKHQTPQKQSAVEGEVPSSPVYQPLPLPTFTPTFLIRKLRSTKSGIFCGDEDKGPAAAKICRHSLLNDESQPGSSGVSFTSTERSESRKSAALRNAESPASESNGGPFGNNERLLSASKGKSTPTNKDVERCLKSSIERSTTESEERPVIGSKARSASSEERSASGSKEKGRIVRSRSKEKFSEDNKPSSSSQALTGNKRKTRNMSSQRITTKRHSTSKEAMREGEVPDSSDFCVTDDSSRQSAQTSVSNCSGQTVDSVRIDASHSLRMKLVRSPCTRVSKTVTKRVKLSHSWQLLSDNSMSRLLRSDTEVSSFDGFQDDDPLPSDLTYVSASEVEVTDDEDRVWLIDDEEGALHQTDKEQGSELLIEFIPTFSSPVKSSSSWIDACDQYVNQSVEQQLKCRQKGPRSPHKDFVQSHKHKHASNGRHSRQNAKTGAKRRKLKRIEKDDPEVCGTCTPNKRERRNGILYESEALIHVEKILFSCASPNKCQSSAPASPPKAWNGDCKNMLPQSPKQSRDINLPPAKPPPPAIKI